MQEAEKRVQNAGARPASIVPDQVGYIENYICRMSDKKS